MNTCWCAIALAANFSFGGAKPPQFVGVSAAYTKLNTERAVTPRWSGPGSYLVTYDGITAFYMDRKDLYDLIQRQNQQLASAAKKRPGNN